MNTAGTSRAASPEMAESAELSSSSSTRWLASSSSAKRSVASTLIPVSACSTENRTRATFP